MKPEDYFDQTSSKAVHDMATELCALIGKYQQVISAEVFYNMFQFHSVQFMNDIMENAKNHVQAVGEADDSNS